MWFPLSKTAKGRHYERRAQAWLQQQGLIPVASNVRFKGGELDLVMKDGDCWVFIEVKYRRDKAFGGAAGALSRAQQQRLLKAASRYLSARGLNLWDSPCRFDVICFDGSEEPDWIRSAFAASL
ncbi:YraN family protein [Gallaecimonas sp. GXIMD4217]|uniref:YraN family protein n=1 Tax=Gallaecimonas sp. GXIMD4217 TaxID=3131927 RepID=UPI00311ABEC7